MKQSWQRHRLTALQFLAKLSRRTPIRLLESPRKVELRGELVLEVEGAVESARIYAAVKDADIVRMIIVTMLVTVEKDGDECLDDGEFDGCSLTNVKN